jgi:hypothetical protein
MSSALASFIIPSSAQVSAPVVVNEDTASYGAPLTHTLTGQIVTINGTLIDATNRQILTGLYMVSNGTQESDWITMTTDPVNITKFYLPAQVIFHYGFKLQFLKPGTYVMQPTAVLYDFGYPLPNSTDSNPLICSGCRAIAYHFIVSDEGISSSTEFYTILGLVLAVTGSIGTILILAHKRRVMRM